MNLILFILVPKHLTNPGMATEQQLVFMILSTDKKNKYPRFIKLAVIPVDNKELVNKFFHMKAKTSQE